MRWKDCCGCSVIVMDRRGAAPVIKTGKLIRVTPGWKIVIGHNGIVMEDIRIAKDDVLEFHPSLRTDTLTITRGQPKEKRLRIEPIGMAALEALENLFQSDRAEEFDRMAAMKLGM